MDLTLDAAVIAVDACPACAGTGKRSTIDGRTMRRMREDASVNMGQMARALGISVTYVSDMELDKRRFTQELAAEYLRVLRGEILIPGADDVTARLRSGAGE